MTGADTVVAVDEMAGMTSLALGVRPACVFASLGDRATSDILSADGIEVRDRSLFSLPDESELATIDPDIIVGTGAASPYGKRRQRWSSNARTVVFDIETPWEQTLSSGALQLGAESAGRSASAAMRSLLAEIREQAQQRTLSYLAHTSRPFTAPPHVPVSSLIADAGFVRPAVQQTESNTWSSEVDLSELAAHDAEFIIIPEGEGSSARPISEHRCFSELAGKVIHPSARQWFGNSPLSFWVIAADLLSVATDSYHLTDDADVRGAWEDYRRVVGV